MTFPMPKDKTVKGMLTIALDKKQKSNMSNNATAFPPSPPALTNQYMQFTVNSKKRRSWTTQHDTKRPRIEIMSKESSHNNNNDNLLLLATQATQMRDLPLSPAVSPTGHDEQPQRLPSLKTMILELSHHTNSNQDMNSRA
ncbi:hypothetical protein K501DRAFT_283432 [Backusella circina FSU 941]|nr:hypothetical protein K501DRAFT_283432 [Backusella circina FSU 941]